MNKKILYLTIAVVILLFGASAVTAIVPTTPPKAIKGDNQLMIIWNYLVDLQQQITNIQLIPGPQGPAGPEGPAGPAGADGATGPAGPVGATGATGATGASGPAGPAGADGQNGADGATVHFGERTSLDNYEILTAVTDGFLCIHGCTAEGALGAEILILKEDSGGSFIPLVTEYVDSGDCETVTIPINAGEKIQPEIFGFTMGGSYCNIWWTPLAP